MHAVNLPHWHESEAVDHPTWSLLLTCKQIYLEAKEIPHIHNKIAWHTANNHCGDEGCNSFLQCVFKSSPRNLQRLRHVWFNLVPITKKNELIIKREFELLYKLADQGVLKTMTVLCYPNRLDRPIHFPSRESTRIGFC